MFKATVKTFHNRFDGSSYYCTKDIMVGSAKSLDEARAGARWWLRMVGADMAKAEVLNVWFEAPEMRVAA